MAQSLEITNLFSNLPPIDSAAPERFEPLFTKPGLKVERIISTGQITPSGEWYDQPHDEWVALLSGAARLRFEGDSEEHALEPGDSLLIPARCRHRVEWTDPTTATVWLAIHVGIENETTVSS